MRLRSQSTEGTGTHSTQTFVVFDQVGAIIHVHAVVTVEGAEQKTEEVMRRRAIELAVERGFDESSIRVIQVDPGRMEPGVRYRVDPASMTLREQERARNI
jgi:hypothetical protein